MNSGRVTHANTRIARIAIEADTGGWVVGDIMDANEVELGDVLTGPMRQHGQVELLSGRTGRPVRVYIEAIDAGPENVRALLSGG